MLRASSLKDFIKNGDLWAVINFAGEDHTSLQTLVAFLRMRCALALMRKVLQKFLSYFRVKFMVDWGTLLECLSIYEARFKLMLQNFGSLLLDFQEGDAQALVAYLNVL
ncbi:nuclear pore complex protein NUP205-like [Dioscorea cayenensis subsp. rotundata]|uniref:Nuclear pore complex protein NUP205-like n=1 Tax=Dioscorea cayennensis subsp. rotundata TaxID=55577 RepID=A0AB40CI61_DIOCR|nr:nuclear pore complex protein NUP205-like [Dioscorea cayenensis subsp. rotundata]XP_039138436.1 nuclear pore complex protein NUP205-like [Dioscorea cayenensis subsp. rotundata]